MKTIKNFFSRENNKIKNTHEINLKNLENEHNRKIEEENKNYYEAISQIEKKNKKKKKIVKQNGRNDEYIKRKEEY
jgi:CII-binding regulator of phage lambda lysogenization HflD